LRSPSIITLWRACVLDLTWVTTLAALSGERSQAGSCDLAEVFDLGCAVFVGGDRRPGTSVA